MRNERGSIAIDFIFAFTLIFGFIMILFTVALSLSAVEMVQYMTFAAARRYHASHITQEDQKAAALNKYQEVLNLPAYAMIARGSWFRVDQSPYIGDASQRPGLEQYDQGNRPSTFEGVVTTFTAAVLAFEIKGFGSTAPEDDGDGSSFRTNIGSYVGREPSMEECVSFINQRWQSIQEIDNSYKQVSSSPAYNQQLVANDMTDNGC